MADVRGFAGATVEGESGLAHMGARHYDPTTGRFLQTDPLGIGADQLYAYAAGNPYLFWDPTGLSPQGIPTDPLLEDAQRVAGSAVHQFLNASHDEQMALSLMFLMGGALEFSPGLGDLKGFYDFYESPSFGSGLAAAVGVIPGGDLWRGTANAYAYVRLHPVEAAGDFLDHPMLPNRTASVAAELVGLRPLTYRSAFLNMPATGASEWVASVRFHDAVDLRPVWKEVLRVSPELRRANLEEIAILNQIPVTEVRDLRYLEHGEVIYERTNPRFTPGVTPVNLYVPE